MLPSHLCLARDHCFADAILSTIATTSTRTLNAAPAVDNPNMHSAFQLLVDIVFEQDTSILPYVPLLLQNALVLYGKESASSKALVTFLLHSLGFRLAPRRELRPEARHFLTFTLPLAKRRC